MSRTLPSTSIALGNSSLPAAFSFSLRPFQRNRALLANGCEDLQLPKRDLHALIQSAVPNKLIEIIRFTYLQGTARLEETCL